VTVPVLGFGIRPRGPSTAEATDERHHVGGGDGDVEVDHALLDLGGQVVGTDDVGTGVAGGLGGFAGGEHGDADVLAGTAGQRHGATHHLVGLAGVDAEADGDLDGLVELRAGQRLHQASASVGVNSWSTSNFFSASAYFLPDMCVSLSGSAAGRGGPGRAVCGVER
jgi:hypothetical protein